MHFVILNIISNCSFAVIRSRLLKADIDYCSTRVRRKERCTMNLSLVNNILRTSYFKLCTHCSAGTLFNSYILMVAATTA